jgi:hypothetical protein
LPHEELNNVLLHEQTCTIEIVSNLQKAEDMAAKCDVAYNREQAKIAQNHQIKRSVKNLLKKKHVLGYVSNGNLLNPYSNVLLLDHIAGIAAETQMSVLQARVMIGKNPSYLRCLDMLQGYQKSVQGQIFRSSNFSTFELIFTFETLRKLVTFGEQLKDLLLEGRKTTAINPMKISQMEQEIAEVHFYYQSWLRTRNEKQQQLGHSEVKKQTRTQWEEEEIENRLQLLAKKRRGFIKRRKLEEKGMRYGGK